MSRPAPFLHQALYALAGVALLASVLLATPWGIVLSAMTILPALSAGATLLIALATPLLIAAALWIGSRSAGAPTALSLAVLVAPVAWLAAFVGKLFT